MASRVAVGNRRSAVPKRVSSVRNVARQFRRITFSDKSASFLVNELLTQHTGTLNAKKSSCPNPPGPTLCSSPRRYPDSKRGTHSERRSPPHPSPCLCSADQRRFAPQTWTRHRTRYPGPRTSNPGPPECRSPRCPDLATTPRAQEPWEINHPSSPLSPLLCPTANTPKLRLF